MTQSENLLFRFETAYFADHARNPALQAVCWYVSTGRASPAWIKAAFRANPAKFLDYIGDGSVDEEVRRATAYLRRYCKLPT